MAGPTETISFVARRLIQFEKRFGEAEIDQRRCLSNLFMQMSHSIRSMVLELERGNLPNDPCRDLILFSTQLQATAQEELGPSEADRLALALGEASDKEKIYLEFQNSTRKDSLVEELEKATILIQALADGIYVAQSGSAA